MLSSLNDISGLFPGLFQRGESAAAAKGARGEGRHPLADQQSAEGRDRLSLSPQARAAAREDHGKAGDMAAAEADGKVPLGQAGGFIRKALETIRHDLAKALQAFGFDNDTIQSFARAFVEPVIDALKEGVNFTAELSFAAFSQVTMSSSAGVSQSTSLVAQSLAIEVNRDTGEVSVSVAKLSFEQHIQSSGGGQEPLLVFDPKGLATPQELAEKILQSGETPAPAPAEKPAPAEDDAPAEADTLAEDGAETSPSEDLARTLAELREKLAEDAANLQTRLTIYQVTTYRNDKGETITRLLLDAQLRIAEPVADATAQDEAQSLNLTA
ncbi:MAG: hypothetical protein ACFCUW_05285 [Kiloniellaceae bacterium]